MEEFALIKSRVNLVFNPVFNLTIRGSGVGKKLIIFKDPNEPELLLFTECQNSISIRSYYNFNFGNFAGSLINFRTQMQF